MKTNCRKKGVASLWFVIIALVAIGFVGLAMDAAHALLVTHQLQNAADAASLAGAQFVRSSPIEARQAALKIAMKNHADGDPVRLKDNPGNTHDGEVVIGRHDRKTGLFTPTLDGPNAVKVFASRTNGSLGGPVPLLFAPIFGVDQVQLARKATAMIGGGTGAGLITLNETDKWTFRLSGTIELDVFDTNSPDGEGVIQVNSVSEWACKTDGDPTLIASEINVCAENVIDAPIYDGYVNTGMPPIPDPLAELEPPTYWSPDEGGVALTNGSLTLTPTHSWEGIPIMYLSEGILMTGGTLTLDPGIYVLDGAGLNVMGGDLIAHEVMLYIVDTTPGDSNPSHVNLSGNGVVEFTAIEEEPYTGMVIWQARENTNRAMIRGTDQFGVIDGTLYFRDAHVDVVGTSDSFGIAQLICDTVGISGSGRMTINYDGRFPAPGTRIFLVE